MNLQSLKTTEDDAIAPSSPSEVTIDAPITPLKIARYPRTQLKSSESHSSHEYMLRQDSDMVSVHLSASVSYLCNENNDEDLKKN